VTKILNRLNRVPSNQLNGKNRVNRKPRPTATARIMTKTMKNKNNVDNIVGQSVE
jgi:hypothetical protein